MLKNKSIARNTTNVFGLTSVKSNSVEIELEVVSAFHLNYHELNFIDLLLHNSKIMV